MLCYYGDDMEEYRRWEDNIKMDLKEICVNTRDWIDSTQDRDYWRVLVNEVLNLRISSWELVRKSTALHIGKVYVSVYSAAWSLSLSRTRHLLDPCICSFI